ncbi:hypothetical protein CLU79DRAFT_761636 [Phycomyces nitens]|nr:hypothetical protein CLU79DRAFT_761636 [Phycomyces nitens]
MGRVVQIDVPLSVPDSMPHLATVQIALHGAQILLSFLAVCMIGPVIGILNKYNGGSDPAPNWSLFVFFATFGTPFCIVFFPWAYERKTKFKKLAKFFLKPRTNIVFGIFDSVLWATAGIAMTVYSNKDSTCSFDAEKEETFGSSYTGSWATQCNLAKAAAAFSWMTCILWTISLVCSLIDSFREKQAMRNNKKEQSLNRQSAAFQTDFEEEHVGKNYRPVQSFGGERFDGQAATAQGSPFDSPYDPPAEQKQEVPQSHQDSYYHSSPMAPHEQHQYSYQDYRQEGRPEPSAPFSDYQAQPGQYQSPAPLSFSPMPMPESTFHAPRQ